MFFQIRGQNSLLPINLKPYGGKLFTMYQNISEKEMLKMNDKILFLPLIFIFFFQSMFLVRISSGAISDSKKAEEAKILFVEANKFISEDKYNEAFALAEKLIEEYPDDYQIWEYLHFYEHTFNLIDADFRNGQLRPTPNGVLKRIEEIKTNKNALDLVKLSWLVEGKNNGPNVEYLKQIIDKFPDDIWAEWAKSELAMAEILMKGENPDKRYESFYHFGISFINQNPKSHLIPRIICITADARYRMAKNDEKAKNEAVKMLQRILNEYQSDEYECAMSRYLIREILGNNYKEQEGYSAEIDKTTMRFYIHTPDIGEYKNYTQKYLDLKPEALKQVTGDRIAIKQQLAESNDGTYRLVIPSIAIITATVVGGILLYKKKSKAKQL